jgi:hypothetical protein
MSFIVSDGQLVGIISQNGFQTIKPGAQVQLSLSNNPGHLYSSTIGDVVSLSVKDKSHRPARSRGSHPCCVCRFALQHTVGGFLTHFVSGGEQIRRNPRPAEINPTEIHL